LVLAAVGAVYGFVESIRDYPFSSWFGVTIYVAMVAALVGFVVGLMAGALGRLIGRVRAR
jgi:hypothetical protein